MFREKIKVLDCTIRDGGLINNHDFDIRFVREVYKALSEAGVDYMEIGYKNSKKLFSSKEYGKWKFCDDDDIRKVIEGIPSKTKLSVMVDVDRVDEPRSHGPGGVLCEGYRQSDPLGQPFRGQGVRDDRQHHGHLAGPGQRIDRMFGAVGERVQGRRHLYRRQLRGVVSGDDGVPHQKGERYLEDERSGDPRAQQPAVGLRQHDRGDHSRCQLCGRDRLRPGPRRRELSARARPWIFEESQIRYPAYPRPHLQGIHSLAGEDGVGLHHSLRHLRHPG
jgi:hypothetical protein